MSKFRWLAIVACTSLLVVLAAGCGGGTSSDEGNAKKVVVGSKEFTEQLILGQITIKALENAGFEVEDSTGLGGTEVARKALESGEIDMYWEYTGTAWIVALGHEKAITDSEEAYQKVKEEDLEKNNLVWLPYAPFNNTYTIMMRKADAEALGIKSISDLGGVINENGGAKANIDKWVFAADHEFSVRPDGLPKLEETYGFNFDDVKVMDLGVTYGALKEGQVPAAMGFATDGRIGAFNLVNLEDDKKFFPVYNPAPVVRKEIMDKYPEIEEVLAPIAKKLDTETMIDLNGKVDVDGMEPGEVAEEFLKENNFI